MTNHESQFSQDLRALFPRLLYFGVAYGDLIQTAESFSDWNSWSCSLGERAANYEAAADEAGQLGRKTTALDGWRRAADYFHYAQLRLPPVPLKKHFQNRSRNNFLKYAAHITPAVDRIEVQYESMVLPAYFRSAGPHSSLVVLIGGLDSAKEVELSYFAEQFLRRGNSVCFFDGPGQGELNGNFPMPISFEDAVSAVIDYVIDSCQADCHGVGVFGVSFGGYLACRTAAVDPRVKACVCLGGFFDGQIFARLSSRPAETIKRTFGLDPQESLDSLTPLVTLEPLRGQMDKPLFVIHGKEDQLVDISQVNAIAEWALGPKRVWVVDNAEHVCTNRFVECLPELCDWMSEHLNVGVLPALAPDKEIHHGRNFC